VREHKLVYTLREYLMKNRIVIGMLLSMCLLMSIYNAKIVMGNPDVMNSNIVKKTIHENSDLTSTSDFSFADVTTEAIVEITSLETGRGYDEVWKSYYYFFHEEEMVAKITARNGANETKIATLYVNAFDDIGQFFYSHSENVTFSAEETKIIYLPIYIQKWSFSGNQCAITSIAKTLPEGAYCPEKTTGFFLLPIAPTVDTSVVNVTTSTTQVYVRWKVNITLKFCVFIFLVCGRWFQALSDA